MNTAIHPRDWWHEQTFGIGITNALNMRKLYAATSEFQDIEVYEHETFGRVLVLDGTVQLSQADEYIYHEMAVHVPLLGRTRKDVEVLIIGGGDGGILREVLKYPTVKNVVMVEIDPQVVEISNQWIGIQGDYQDPRVTLLFADGIHYMAQSAAVGKCFDLIIIDATDSTGPAKTLWSAPFYESLSACLKNDGVCVDSDILIHGKEQVRLSRDPCEISVFDIVQSKKYFAGVEGYYSKVPLYPGGYFAFFLYTKDGVSHAQPVQEYQGHYYNAALHRAAFALPTWWQNLLR